MVYLLSEAEKLQGGSHQLYMVQALKKSPTRANHPTSQPPHHVAIEEPTLASGDQTQSFTCDRDE